MADKLPETPDTQSTHDAQETEQYSEEQEVSESQETHEAEEPQGSEEELEYASRGKLQLNPSHNQIACLDRSLTANTKMRQMMEFLERSRIHLAITADPPIYEWQVQEFWDTATVDDDDEPAYIYARVGGKDIKFRRQTIRSLLNLQDSERDTTSPSKEKVRGCLYRCGYPELTGQVNKKNFSPPFKYLAHILIHSLSSKKAGSDILSEPLQNIFASLVMNMPLNITGMIWDAFVEAASGNRPKFDFLLYPRFVQLIINARLPNLRKEGKIVSPGKMTGTTLTHMTNWLGPADEKPRDVDFWGAMIDANYRCPPGDEWKNEEEEYDDGIVVLESQPAKPSKGKKALELKRASATLGFSPEISAKRRKASLGMRSSAATSPRPAATSTSTANSERPSDPPTTATPPTVPIQNETVAALITKVNELARKDKVREKKLAFVESELQKKTKEIEELKEKLKEKEETISTMADELSGLVGFKNEIQSTHVWDKDGYARHTVFVTDDDLLDLEGEGEKDRGEAAEKDGGSGTPSE